MSEKQDNPGNLGPDMDEDGNFIPKPTDGVPTYQINWVESTPKPDLAPPPGGGNFIRAEQNKDHALDLASTLVYCQEQNLNPLIYDMFTDPDFVRSLPENMRQPEVIARYLEQSSRFSDLDKREILTDLVQIPETVHADGRIRRAEEGYRVSLDEIRRQGIDPNFILYFRRTRPSDTPKPEHYWTSDYWETRAGLSQEIHGQQRETSVILCSTLADIDKESGLIEDINDDNGLPVRRISQESYDQARCLFRISFE